MKRMIPAWLAGLLVLVFLTSQVAQGQTTEDNQSIAPVTTLSADGRSATDGVRTLTISKAQGVDPEGEVIVVSGSGYDEEKGIYVAFCVIPELNKIPTPCGGGIDLSGGTGSSAWVSSNPPAYGVGLARPYGPGGTFEVSLNIGPTVNETLDCREVRCAIVTRGDHTRTSDRSQDVFVPVTFAVPGQVVEPTPTAVAVAPSPTPPPPTATPFVPASTLAGDGLSVTSGDRRLAVSKAAGLQPAGEMLTVSGTGYDEASGVYVALCALKPGNDVGPCATGSPEVSIWVSTNPPDYGRGIAKPYTTGGRFEVQLLAGPQIDAQTDCRVVACAVVTRKDDAAGADADAPLAIPVSFASEAATANTPAPSSATSSSNDDSGDGLPVTLLAGVLAVAGIAAGGFLWFRRRAGGTGR